MCRFPAKAPSSVQEGPASHQEATFYPDPAELTNLSTCSRQANFARQDIKIQVGEAPGIPRTPPLL